MRVAVITPYYKEPEAWLARCLTSVREQSYPVTHFVVADGHPQAWVDEAGVRHLKPVSYTHLTLPTNREV